MRPWQRAAGWLHRFAMVLPAVALAQEVPIAPAVQADRVVVEEAAPRGPVGSSTRANLDDLEPAASGGWGQVTSQVPNLEMESAGPSAFGAILALRGLTNTPYFSDPAVTLYMDDIPMGGGFTYPAGLFGFVSATVHSGPQGSEFGRAEDGGVIVLSPRLTMGGDLRAGFGDYGARSFALEGETTEGEKRRRERCLCLEPAGRIHREHAAWPSGWTTCGRLDGFARGAVPAHPEQRGDGRGAWGPTPRRCGPPRPPGRPSLHRRKEP